MVVKCPEKTKAGKPCRGRVLPGHRYCLAHDPKLIERRQAGNARGGENRANARRAARLLAAAGEVIEPVDLPAMLRSCILKVAMGQMEPGQATAIAALAKASVSLSSGLEIAERLDRLEEAAGAKRSGSGDM